MTTTDADPFANYKAAQREGWASFLPVEVISTIPAAKLVKFAEVTPGQRLLDVACGTGVVAITAARRGAKVSGLDLTPVLLERARHNASVASVDIDFIEGDAEALPYPDSSFDVVLSQFGHIFVPRPAVVARADASSPQERRPHRVLDLAARAFYRPHVFVFGGLFAAASTGSRTSGTGRVVGRSQHRA